MQSIQHSVMIIIIMDNDEITSTVFRCPFVDGCWQDVCLSRRSFCTAANVFVWCQSRADQSGGGRGAPCCAEASHMLPQQTLRSRVYLPPSQLARRGHLWDQQQLYLDSPPPLSSSFSSSCTVEHLHHHRPQNTFHSPHLTAPRPISHTHLHWLT